MKVVQIIPIERKRLYGAMVKKEAAIRKKGTGTFYRARARRRNAAKWRHTKYKGWVNLERGLSEVVTAEVNSLALITIGNCWQHFWVGLTDISAIRCSL